MFMIEPHAASFLSWRVQLTALSKKRVRSKKHAGRRGLRVTLHLLTADQALAALLAIKPEDVKRIVGKPKDKKRG